MKYAKISSGKESRSAGKTDERIKQVYFPVEAEKYHLLSVLPSASLLMERNSGFGIWMISVEMPEIKGC